MPTHGETEVVEKDYNTLNRKRAAQLGQVTKIHNQVKDFDPLVNSLHVLKNHRECLAAVNRQHQVLINEMMDHSNADFDEIEDLIDAFRTAHSNATIELEEQLEKAKVGSRDDVLQALENEIVAIRISFDEFKEFTDVCDEECLSPNELRPRLKDLQALNVEYVATWKKLFDLAEDPRKAELRNDRRTFTTDFYKTVGWFDSKVNPRSQNASRTSAVSASTVKLPKIELQTFDGAPDNWIPYRDSYKSLVHNVSSISGAVKFRYLKATIVDKFSPIKHLLETEDGYEAAWQAVLDYYDDNRRIVDCHISGMLKVKPMETESHDELQRVLNDFSLHIDSLERMHNEQELYQAFLAHIALQRLDPHTRDLWETDNKGQVPLWPSLKQFLKERRKTLSTLPAKTSQPRNFSKGAGKTNSRTSNTHAASKCLSSPNAESQNAARGKISKCYLCAGDHRLHVCPQFLNLPIPNRLAKVKEWKICTNCFGSHAVNACTTPFRCKVCKQQHHTMLHLEAPPAQKAAALSLQAPPSSLQADALPFLFSSSSCNTASRSRSSVTLLQTAIVQIKAAHGEWHSVRALLDPGSDSNYISKSAAYALNIPLEPTYIEANGLGGKRAAVIKHKLSTRIGTRDESFEMELLVTPKVTNPTPTVPITANLEIPVNLTLADPTFNVPGKIDILIGNEHYGDLIRDGRIKLASGPTLLNTIFGWIFTGSVSQSTKNSPSPSHQRAAHLVSTQCHHNTLAELKESVERFYKLEDYRNEKRFLTDEEAHCEKVFEQTHTRTSTGRFKIFLPLKETISQVNNNYRRALCLFLVLEKRLQKNEALRTAYIEFIREFISLGHMTEIDISDESADAPAFYFPHHAVEKPDSTTTKLRVVFNGSARTSSGLSFNDAQCVGPQIQSDVFTLALRFRLFPVVIKADIEKMYRQIEVAESQRKYQRIIWRENSNEKLKVFTLNTVTYGTASASFQSTRCLKELAIVNRNKFPKAAEEILNSYYVDDCISGANSVEEAIGLAQDMMSILDSAEMKLRKFSSNSQKFIQAIPEDRREKVQDGTSLKALGVNWDPTLDLIGFVIQPIKYDKITRRTILSEIHRLYDPEGLLGPVTFRFKLFLKRIFKLSMPWDAPVPPKDAEEWTEIASQFPVLSNIQIPRLFVLPNYTEVQLHGFCDASDEGYGIAIYLRSRDSNNHTLSRLVCSKSRVAPTEYRSTARLELCGAVMLANMMNQVSKALKIPFSKKICWSDSAIVLQWLKKSPAQLQTFVANRVSEIQELSSELVWKHIRGEINPADIISRGLTPLEIISCQLWWNGPEFLGLPELKWPKSIVEVDPKDASFVQEFKKVESLVHATSIVQPHSADSNPFLDWIEDSSRTWSVKRKIAPIMRVIHNMRARKLEVPRRTGPVQVADMVDAEYALARIYQANFLQDDFQQCSKGKPISKQSSIKNLDPIWDGTHKLIRVGGRLNHADHCDEAQKHPIILPSCHLARLIIRETHQQNLHAGQNATLSFVRLRYWPLRSKHIVRQEVHKCIKCFRARPQLQQQFMGQLPAARITPAPPFYNTGVDYCGPFDIKLSKTRNAKTGKSYVALFVCLGTKAIHMEIVSDLSTSAFFAAFDKFISRRGLPCTMNSDNGLNFVGAGNDLRDLYQFLASETTQSEIRNYLNQQEIQWNFIPPRAPAHGGLWEAGVKSMKHHFHRAAKNALLTFEEFDQLKAKIEAILNSRPLTAISDDPSDLSALTAGHFLIGRPLIAKPDRDFASVSMNRLQRWDRVVQMQQQFWKRWSRDYLHQLQVRTKNYKNVVPVTVGQLVLLHIDNCPSMCWPLGRITRIYPGTDGITRVASIRTSKSTYERPVDKLALLPITPDDDQLEPAEDVRNLNSSE